MPTCPLPDVSLAYEQAGERGPVVLLVQGTGCLGRGWQPQIDGLRADHRLIWFDNRGIGGSQPLRGGVSVDQMGDDCIHLLDHLGIERAHLVGHSLGGMIVQAAARRHAKRIASLSLLSTSPRGRDVAIPGLANLRVSLRMLFGSERSRWLAAAGLCFPPAHLATLSDEEKLRTVQHIFCPDFLQQPAIVRQQIAAMWHDRGGDMTPLRDIPTLILTGQKDIVVPTRLSEELHRLLPASRIERFADAGHGLPLHLVEPVNQALRQHIAAAP